ncbi:MAG: type 11 methyltransferase [Candidatus Taylorbacteria bacterium]|nr:type 11 methyltransferase [Candidatus Taylorbacteria bacterium]
MFSNPEKNLIQFGISVGMQIADFGSGNGYYAFLLARKVGETGRVYCIDVQSDMLQKIAKEAETENIQNIEIITSDIEKEKGSTLTKDSVDVVLIANTLFQNDDKHAVAKEALRILRVKGRVLVIEWADSFAGMGPHKDHLVKKEDALKIFTDAGLVLDHEIDAGEHHYGLVFRK